MKHYRVGWSSTTACGREASTAVTRDPSRVECRKCRATILRMARTWDGIVALGQVQP